MLQSAFRKSIMFFSNMLNIYSFAILNFIKYKQMLRQVLLYDKPHVKNNIDFSVPNLLKLDPNVLKSWNIQALILDYDGVLAYYAENQPIPAILRWLEEALHVFGKDRIFILSNNPALPRKNFFDRYFNENIIFVVSKPKPDPSGIIYIHKYLTKHSGITIPKEQILLVDDRIATGILAAKIFGIGSCLILDPYVSINKNLIIEFSLVIIRKLERLIVWHL